LSQQLSTRLTVTAVTLRQFAPADSLPLWDSPYALHTILSRQPYPTLMQLAVCAAAPRFAALAAQLVNAAAHERRTFQKYGDLLFDLPPSLMEPLA
jgi:hypothetical protein